MQHPRRTAARFLVAILLLSTLSPAAVFADTAFSLHAVRYNLTYVAGQLSSFFSNLADAIASHIPVTSLTASAAAPAPSPIVPPAPALGFLATTTPEASTPPTTSNTPTTVIQQPVVERIVEKAVPQQASAAVSPSTLATLLANLRYELLARINAVASAPIAFSGPAATTPLSTATFAPSQRIDQLTNTAINTPTITGGSITGASVSGYLPLSGGTLSGTLSGTDLDLSGVLTAGTLSVGGLSSSGALTGPYFTATSTTATSTFAGPMDIGSGTIYYDPVGYVGTPKVTFGKTTPASVQINETDTTGFQIHRYGSTFGPEIRMRSGWGTIAAPATTTAGQFLGTLEFEGFNGSSFGRGAQIYAVAADNASSTNSSAYLGFATTPFGATNNTERMRITSSGNVGIGTNAPSTILSVVATSTATTTGSQLDLRSLRTAIVADNLLGGIDFTSNDTNLTSPGVKVASIQAIANTTHTASVLDTNIVFSGTTGTTLAELMRLTGAGSVGIGTTTPTAQLSTTGTVRFAGLGSGGANLVTDALGNVTASSDERLKDKQGDFTRGLAAINAISPVLYKWRPETGFDTQSTYAGFFAQNVQVAIPEAVSPDSRGYLTLADRPILAALVNAVKELATKLDTFAERFTTKQLTFVRGEADDLTLNQRLCIKNSAGTPVCVTGDQLAALLSQTGAAAAPASVIPSAPVIELNGNASSTIDIGDTYNDLGARIIAPESDLNLGLVILLDGAITTQVSIDTSTPAEHTILYTVTSPTTGLTGSATRTVIVSPVAQPITDFGMTPPPQPDSQLPPDEPQSGNDNPFNAAEPANDNAPSTHVLSAS